MHNLDFQRDGIEQSMGLIRARVSSAVKTGVFPRFTEYLGPRTEPAGFAAITWPGQIQPLQIAAYIEGLQASLAPPSVKQRQLVHKSLTIF